MLDLKRQYASIKDEVAEAIERVPCRCVARLRAVAEREQRFLAAGRCPRLRNGENLLDGEVRRFEMPGRAREGAVVTDIPAQVSERDEDLA